MTVPRWPLLFAAVALLPGCLIIGPSSSHEPTPKAAEPAGPVTTPFAILPSRPGEKIATNAGGKKTPPTVASRPPAPTEAPEAPQPPEGFVPVAAEPTQFPLLANAPTPAADSPLLAAVRAYVENRPDRAIERMHTTVRLMTPTR